MTPQLQADPAQTLQKLRLLHDLLDQKGSLPEEDRAAYDGLRHEVATEVLPLVRAVARAGLLTATVEDREGQFLAGWEAVDVGVEDALAAGTILLVCRQWQGGTLDLSGQA
jgi:hypothetical protein